MPFTYETQRYYSFNEYISLTQNDHTDLLERKLEYAHPVDSAIIKLMDSASMKKAVEKVVETAKRNNYELIIIADHGNADHALNKDGSPNTAHSLNPVPFIYVSKNESAVVENGILADVAPSVCHLLGIKQPAEMTGKNLIK